jgi:hypothetical protein
LSGFKAQKLDEPDGQTPENIWVNRTSESSIIEAQNEPLVRNNLLKNNTIISATATGNGNRCFLTVMNMNLS